MISSVLVMTKRDAHFKLEARVSIF